MVVVAAFAVVATRPRDAATDNATAIVRMGAVTVRRITHKPRSACAP